MIKNNLPVQVSSFIGRTQEITSIANRINDDNCRLLTILGTGGIGKTRLAIEVARAHIEQFPDGVYFVDLKTVSTPNSILQSIADTLEFRFGTEVDPQDQLINTLKNKRLLLLMDNFEHLIDGIEFLAEIIQKTSDIKFLVTSREALNLQFEWIHQVRGLDYPATAKESSEKYSAIQLFTERAGQIRTSFSLEKDYDCVIHICQLVEGMPLGIELATTWLRHLSCSEIVLEIERNLDFLRTNLHGIPERHRSLRTVFDYSWQLLNEAEQQAFMKFSVFRGGCTRESASAVTGASLSMLSSLLDKSLLRLNLDGRYDIHELLRQYVEEKLIEEGIQSDLQDVHCRYYLNLLYELEEDVYGRRQVDALNEIEADIENIRIAWNHAIRHRNYDLINKSLLCLRLFYIIRNRWLELSLQFNHALEGLAPEVANDPHPVWYRIYIRFNVGNSFETTPQHIARAEQNLQIARALNIPIDEAHCLQALADITLRYQVSDEVLNYARKALAIYQYENIHFRYKIIFGTIASYYKAIGQFDECIRYWKQSIDSSRECGDDAGLAGSLSWLAYTLFSQSGDYKECENYLRESYKLRHRLKQADGIATNAAFLSRFAILDSDIEGARAYVEEALSMKTEYGWRQSEQIALNVNIFIAIYEENFEKGREISNNLSRNSPHELDWLLSNIASSLCYCGVQDFQSAKPYLQSAYGLVDPLAPLFRTQLLTPLAFILNHEGQPELASECLGLAFEYPGSHSAMMQDWLIMTKLIDELEHQIGNESYREHYEIGMKQNLKGFLDKMMQAISGDSTNQAVQEANASLIEPLTERELEVVQLLVAGLSNREMAKKLFVSLGTIKKHNNNIYGKLEASNRTQAISCARELGLIFS